MLDPAVLMQRAIDKALAGVADGQTPFGCAIALGDQILAVEHNTVWATTDITAHAEVNALRAACRATGDVHLTSAVVATTCEPCPMCLAALHWARVETVYHGASIADAAAAGFNEMHLAADDMIRLSGSRLKLAPGPLADDCRRLFDAWRARQDSQAY